MTQQTLNFLHQSYQEALKKSGNIIQIVENLYDILVNADVPDEDSKEYDAFIDGLKSCLRIRKMTSDITDVVTYTTITIMHIIKWLNATKEVDIDINLHGRRKSLESDLTKLLRKSTQTLSAKIRDRFGLRGTILNVPEEVAIEYIYLIYDAITGIITSKNRKMRQEFISWIEHSEYINPLNKDVVMQVLEIPFDIDDTSIKDYIKNQKENGYESLHFTLVIQPYSSVIPGSELEIQLRTKKMDTNAESGSASHEEYKKYQGEKETSLDENPLLKVFVVDDFSQLHITGFRSYESKFDDEDGIHFSKEFADRRISSTLVPLPPSL